MNFNDAFTQVIQTLVAGVMPSLVVVKGRQFGAGAGVIWAENGLVLTNNHVVGKQTPLVVLQDDREYESRLLARDPDVDLALLSIAAAGLSPLRPAPALPRVGELVFAFGHPWGQRNTVTRGIVSALAAVQNRRAVAVPIVRSDVPLAPGNSGGPLINARGEVVGINAMIVGGDQSVSIAVTVVNEFVQKVMGGEQTVRPRPERTPADVF